MLTRLGTIKALLLQADMNHGYRFRVCRYSVHRARYYVSLYLIGVTSQITY
jgi:hypothetical protein